MSPDQAARTLLILGASGDLTARLLLPGLGQLVASEGLDDLLLVGSGRDEWAETEWRERVAGSFAAADASGRAVDAVVAATQYVQADVTDPGELRALLGECEAPVVIYFALPPSVTEHVCEALREIGASDGTRLVLEKPFGTDAASAAALNELLTSIVREDQIHRVDHFLGMSTVLNIVGVRFANRIFEPVLDNNHVASVEVVFDESLGLEGRAGYYDAAGALIDMVQSHLLQVLSLVAMEAPASLEARDLRACRAQVLRATRIWDGDPSRYSRRARYTSGTVDGRALGSYADEQGIDPARKTETYAEIVVAVDTWRWAGVPFRLRSGKAIGDPRMEVAITFRDPPRIPDGLTDYQGPDRLRIGIAPGAGKLFLEVNVNGPGDPAELDRTTFAAEVGAGALHEYGEVLKRIIAGDPRLSVRGDVAVECWRIVEPVLEAWRRDEVPLFQYKAGSAGPPSIVVG